MQIQTPLLTCEPSTWRIVVIDDNVESLKLVDALFRARGISIKTYDNVPDGLQAIRDGNANILLLDLMLPGDASGWELHSQLYDKDKENLADTILIVAFTGLTEKRDLERAIEQGFEGLLTKPFDPLKIFILLGAFVGQFLARRGRKCLPIP